MPVYFWRSAGAAYRDLPEYGDRLQYARGNDNGYTQAANDFRHVQQPCESYGGKRHRRSDGSAHSNALRACLRCSGAPTVLVCGKPLLNNTSKCMCSWGGVISVTATPAVTINVP